MRTLNIIIGFFIIFAPISVLAQKNGDNTVILRTENTSETNYTDLGRLLTLEGYEFLIKDDQFLRLQTKWKQFSYKNGRSSVTKQISLNFLFQDGDIICEIHHKTRGMRGTRAVFDEKISWTHEPFKVLHEIFAKLDGDINYIKK